MPRANAAMARDLASLSSDCSFLLTHLIRQNDGRGDAAARNILLSILNIDEDEPQPLLQAAPVGWYSAASPSVYDPEADEFHGPLNTHAVCFTESTLAGLKAHRDVFKARFGLAFDRDWVFERGGNPCLNIRESLLKERFTVPGEQYPRRVYNFIPQQLHPFINIIHESFDATHEREWRQAGDLRFDYNDILFVFCPQQYFPTFSPIQTDGLPVLFDLDWLDRV